LGWQFLEYGLQPRCQFAAFFLVQLLYSCSKSVQEFLTAVQPLYEWLQSVLLKVLAVQAVLLLWSGYQLTQSLLDECSKTAITSQVVATRSNNDEWRQCLQLGANWNSCSLQGAYRLWQSQSMGVPACPANQWMRVPSGQPLLPSDEAVAIAEISAGKLALKEVESRVTEFHERKQFLDARVQKFSPDQVQAINEVEELYKDLVAKSRELHQNMMDSENLPQLTEICKVLEKAEAFFQEEESYEYEDHSKKKQ